MNKSRIKNLEFFWCGIFIYSFLFWVSDILVFYIMNDWTDLINIYFYKSVFNTLITIISILILRLLYLKKIKKDDEKTID